MRKILLVLGAVLLFSTAGLAQTDPPVRAAWNISFTLEGMTTPQQFRFVAFGDRTGAFRFMNPSTATGVSFPAVWDRPDQTFYTFSGEVRIGLDGPTGTLVFKGRARSGRISGPMVFVMNNGSAAGSPFTLRFGTFTAVPLTATTNAKL